MEVVVEDLPEKKLAIDAAALGAVAVVVVVVVDVEDAAVAAVGPCLAHQDALIFVIHLCIPRFNVVAPKRTYLSLKPFSRLGLDDVFIEASKHVS